MIEVNQEHLNTALILAGVGLLWRTLRKVDKVHDAMFGVNGTEGVLKQLKEVRENVYSLATGKEKKNG